MPRPPSSYVLPYAALYQTFYIEAFTTSLTSMTTLREFNPRPSGLSHVGRVRVTFVTSDFPTEGFCWRRGALGSSSQSMTFIRFRAIIPKLALLPRLAKVGRKLRILYLRAKASCRRPPKYKEFKKCQNANFKNSSFWKV